MRWLLAFFVIFHSTSVFAQVVSIEGLCDNLPVYKQQEGVEHVPGAEDVVPADLNPLKAATPDVINIPIDVILAERFAAVNIPSDLELHPTVATVSVHKDGRVEYNGQDISDQAYRFCEEDSAVFEGVGQLNTEQGNGQQGQDILSSEPEVIEIKDGIEGEVLKGQSP